MEAIEPWMLWLAVALILFAIDILVAGGASGVLLLFALMALGGMVGAMLGLSPVWQVLFTALAGLIMLPVVLIIMRRITGGRLAEHPDGRLATETFKLVQQGEQLRVKALGDSYPIKPDTGVEKSALAAGGTVRIVRFEGITAVVMPVDSADAEITEHD